MKYMKIINEPTVLQAQSVKIDEGCFPRRLVLRKLSDTEWSIHHENLEPKQNGDYLEFHHRDFYWGHYFDSLFKAQTEFENKR